MNTEYETSFLVMPEDTNANSPMIFGGAFFSKMDLCAAVTARRFLYESAVCNAAVTHKFEGTFLRPCYLGDLIHLKGQVVETRKKAIAIKVIAERETKTVRELVAEGHFVFVSVTDLLRHKIEDKPYLLPYAPHGLTLDVDNAQDKPDLRQSKSNTSASGR